MHEHVLMKRTSDELLNQRVVDKGFIGGLGNAEWIQAGSGTTSDSHPCTPLPRDTCFSSAPLSGYLCLAATA